MAKTAHVTYMHSNEERSRQQTLLLAAWGKACMYPSAPKTHAVTYMMSS